MTFRNGKLWNVQKSDTVIVNGKKYKVEKVDSFDPEDEHEEHLKEIYLSGHDGKYLIELTDSLRTFYRLEQPDSFTKKRVEIPIEEINPE
jgi:hypothetical protein